MKASSELRVDGGGIFSRKVFDEIMAKYPEAWEKHKDSCFAIYEGHTDDLTIYVSADMVQAIKEARSAAKERQEQECIRA